MKTIHETLETPILGNYDIAVIGAGPAGCGTALAAARAGAKCILIEKFNCLGGMWTTGLINPLFDSKNKEGILKELICNLDRKQAWGGFWDISFNYEYMKSILDSKMREAGVEVLLNTTFSRTLINDHTVTGVVCENIDGRFAVLADYVIDCTGDAQVAANAGCPFELGENHDHTKCQAMTLMFMVGNIPESYRNGAMIYKELKEVYDKEGVELPFNKPFLIPVPNSHFGVIQYTHLYDYDPTKQRDVNEATIEGRAQMMQAFELLKKHSDTLCDLDLIASSAVLGIRESRRIIGEYTLTADDIINGSQFEDSVADCTFNVDIHTKDNKGQHCQSVKPYQVPLRCLIPKGYHGLLVIGKSISGDRLAMASYRVTGNCFQMGENAGKIIAQKVLAK